MNHPATRKRARPVSGASRRSASSAASSTVPCAPTLLEITICLSRRMDVMSAAPDAITLLFWDYYMNLCPPPASRSPPLVARTVQTGQWFDRHVYRVNVTHLPPSVAHVAFLAHGNPGALASVGVRVVPISADPPPPPQQQQQPQPLPRLPSSSRPRGGGYLPAAAAAAAGAGAGAGAATATASTRTNAATYIPPRQPSLRSPPPPPPPPPQVPLLEVVAGSPCSPQDTGLVLCVLTRDGWTTGLEGWRAVGVGPSVPGNSFIECITRIPAALAAAPLRLAAKRDEVHIEHCTDCQRHQMTTRHKPGSYDGQAARMAQALQARFPRSLDVRLNATCGTTGQRGRRPRLGAFEVR